MTCGCTTSIINRQPLHNVESSYYGGSVDIALSQQSSHAANAGMSKPAADSTGQAPPPTIYVQAQPQVVQPSRCEELGSHLPNTRLGYIGLLMGLMFFPFGCVWTALDTQTSCARCGEGPSDGWLLFGVDQGPICNNV